MPKCECHFTFTYVLAYRVDFSFEWTSQEFMGLLQCISTDVLFSFEMPKKSNIFERQHVKITNLPSAYGGLCRWDPLPLKRKSKQIFSLSLLFGFRL